MHLVLFFSYGASLQYWQETGLFEREIQLYKKLESKGVHVTFLTYGDESDFKFSNQLGGIRVLPAYSGTYRPKSNFAALLHSLLLPWFFRKNLAEADLYKTNQMSGSWVALIAKLIHRKKLVLRCGYELYSFVYQQGASVLKRCKVYLLETIAYHLADKIFLTTEDEKNYIIKKFAIPEQSIRVISNFIETGIFKPGENRNRNKSRLLFVGRLSDQKNLLNLIEALEGTALKLDMVGEGELKEIIRNYARTRQVSINFLGKISNRSLPDLINQYEIFVLPSLYEGNPKAMLEAMSCGLAVVGTKVSGIQNIIEHNVNGLLCETSPDSLKNAILRLVSDEALRKKLGCKAREYVVRHCELDLIADREYRHYLELANCQTNYSNY